MQTSPDSSQPEGASLETYCSASFAHGTARTEAERLGLLACLATSKFKRNEGSLPVSFRSPALKMRTSAYISQPEGTSLESCCSASSVRGTARTEARREGLLLVLLPKIQKYPGDPCRAPFASLSENANVSR